MAVASRQEGLDPVGATVGQRGARVQAVVAELSGEKIDVIPWNDDAGVFVANALSPAQVISVDIDEEARIANVTVPERMLSLAIGREGQNARLAARLTGWRIDIRSDVSVAEAKAVAAEAQTEPEAVAAEPVATARGAVEAAPAKPKRVTKKAAAEAAAAETTTDTADAEDAPAKPKRATKKAAAAATPRSRRRRGACEAEARHEEGRRRGAVAETPAADATEAAAKPKRVTKKAAKATETATEEVAS